MYKDIELVQQILGEALQNGGYTHFVRERRGRYIVGDGRYGTTKKFVSAQQIHDMLGFVRVAPEYDGMGVWLSVIGAHSTWYIDPITATHDYDEAIRLAKLRGEQAIFDMQTQEVITVS